jgi:hypothetical protein
MGKIQCNGNIDCKYGASFSLLKNEGKMYCKKHSGKDMKNHKNEASKYKCKEEGCSTKPKYNFDTEKKPLYCATHAKPSMTDTRKSNCVLKDCNRRLSNRSLIHCLFHSEIAKKKLIEGGVFY